MNDLEIRVLNTIDRHHLIDDEDTVVVGVSGGPDSVCLLCVLKEISFQKGLTIHAVHINHMLRGDESDDDQKYVSSLCKSMDISLHVFNHDIRSIAAENRISLEEAGRNVRYEDFYKVAGEIGAAKIAVAHNKNDQAETILMHILRGTGLDGLKGMDYSRLSSSPCLSSPQPVLIRPLLDVSRSDIEAYCRDKGLMPRIDSSNLSGEYRRNKVRHALLPLMSEITGASAVDPLCRMGEAVTDDVDFLRKYTMDAFLDCKLDAKQGVWLDTAKFTLYHPAIQKRLVRCALSSLHSGLKGIEHKHIAEAANLALKGRTGAEIQLPGGLRVQKSYNRLGFSFKKVEEQTDFCCNLEIPGRTNAVGRGYSLDASIEKNTGSIEQYTHMGYNSLVQYFDYDKAGNGINIRNRNPGDVFRPLGCKGTKKLKEYLIDEKIPRDARSRLPIVARDTEILWIIGYKISDKFKVTENTKNVLKLEFEVSIGDGR